MTFHTTNASSTLGVLNQPWYGICITVIAVNSNAGKAAEEHVSVIEKKAQI